MAARVLIVDDSALARRTARQMIESLGHAVDEAADGEQALERYSLHHHDLVVLDLVMNGMYGMDVLARLREFDPPARVVVVTADIQTSTVEQVRAAGAVGLLNKPLNRHAFSELLSKVLTGGTGWN